MADRLVDSRWSLREESDRLPSVHTSTAAAVLFRQPLVNVKTVRSLLGASHPTASKLVSSFEERSILEEMTGYKRNRVFRYTEYLGLFAEPSAAPHSRWTADDSFVEGVWIGSARS